jgi:hypothetical protein
VGSFTEVLLGDEALQAKLIKHHILLSEVSSKKLDALLY